MLVLLSENYSAMQAITLMKYETVTNSVALICCASLCPHCLILHSSKRASHSGHVLQWLCFAVAPNAVSGTILFYMIMVQS